MQTAKNCANRIIRLEVIWFFLSFQIPLAAILDFGKCTFGAKLCLGSDEWKLGLKLGENRSNGSEVIRILVIISKILNGAGGHLGFWNSRCGDHWPLMSALDVLNLVQIWSYSICCKFYCFLGGHLVSSDAPLASPVYVLWLDEAPVQIWWRLKIGRTVRL